MIGARQQTLPLVASACNPRLVHVSDPGEEVNGERQQPTEPSNQPIRVYYLDHVTGYQPITDQYFLVWSVERG